jgi:hypothetical protein
MSVNPYESPVDDSLSKPTDPLRFPAIGCFVAAILGFLWSIWMLYVTATFFELARRYEAREAAAEGWDMLQSTGWLVLLCILALFVAWSMHNRRNRLLVLISSIAGIFLCLPAPLAAVILMRLRRKEVWESFHAKPSPVNPAQSTQVE